MTHEDKLTLLGKKVKVTLGYGGYPDKDSPATVTTGTLLGFGEGGTLEILEDDGFVHYCWPMLEVEAAKED